MFVTDLASRAEPLRQQMWRSRGWSEPFPERRRQEVHDFDVPFATHRRTAWLHVIPGGTFLALAPLQFSSRLRKRYTKLHRVSGRMLLISGALAAGAGLYFGLLMPFGGGAESVAIAAVSAAFFISIVRGFIAIRRGRIVLHREWMIRAFALAIGVSTVRVVSGIFDLALTSRGYSIRELFVLSIWCGWILTVVVAELWIRYTRVAVLPLSHPAAAHGSGI